MKDWTPLVTPVKISAFLQKHRILWCILGAKKLKTCSFSKKNKVLKEDFTNIVAPLDFVGSRIGSDFTVHIHVIALRNGFGIDAAAKTQSHFGWI